jgi:ribosomal protein L11 methyltransferase
VAEPAPISAPLHQLIVEVERSGAAAVESVLEALGALSVTLRDAGDEPLLEPLPGERPLWRRVRVEALFRSLPAPARLDAALGDAVGRPCVWRATPLAERDWVRETQAAFPARRYGRALWVCPSWDEAPDGGTVVRLDPGIAFGTGTHPTTALCLEWLDAHPPAGRTVVDYGCGSGILGIAAALLGARRVHATDIDAQAREATRDNARRNGLDESRLAVAPPDRVTNVRADVVMANILHGPLLRLEPRLAELTRPGGTLVLSGLLQDQADALRAAYRPDFHFTDGRQSGEWILLEARRR